MMQFEEYNVQSHYNTLKTLEEASQTYKNLQASQTANTLIRDLFVQHRVQETLGLSLLHKHFPMNDNEKLVSLGAISYPWDVSGEARGAANKVYPASWRFTSAGGIAPYEFSYSAEPPKTVDMSSLEIETFLKELQTLLKGIGLISLFGIRVLDAEKTEEGIEFTMEKANITVPPEVFGGSQDGDVEALWVFETTAESISGEPIVYKKCKVSCRLQGSRHIGRHLTTKF